MAESGRTKTRIPADQSLQEHLVRGDEREKVLAEVEEDEERLEAEAEERDKAVMALLVFVTGSALVILPIWAAILGASWWVLKTTGGAPSPW